jgi:hypothetical protein
MEIGAYVSYVSIGTAIILAFLAYWNQLRLRAFELFLARRDSVLGSIEKFIGRLYEARAELHPEANKSLLDKYVREFNYEGEILYHKAKGANFGKTANELLEGFLKVLKVPFVLRAAEESFDPMEWITHLTNILTDCYGVAHRQVSREVESIAFTFWGNFKRRRLSKWRKIKISQKDN